MIVSDEELNSRHNCALLMSHMPMRRIFMNSYFFMSLKVHIALPSLILSELSNFGVKVLVSIKGINFSRKAYPDFVCWRYVDKRSNRLVLFALSTQ